MKISKADISVLFICKASVKDGLGHLYRAGALAQSFIVNKIKINFIYISKDNLSSKINLDAPINNIISEFDIVLDKSYDLCIIDLLDLSLITIDKLINKSKILVSISPIFNHMDKVDILFHRTKYLNLEISKTPRKVYKSLDYCIIKDGCIKISTSLFKANLQKTSLPIAISMGGTDPHNLTHKIISALSDLTEPIQLWVILGQGYKYSYDELVTNANKNNKHEIILIKSNKSLWEILQNCGVCILIGGVTAYEAAYAGLPSIILHPKIDRKYLVQELFDNNQALDAGPIDTEFNTLKQIIISINSNTEQLLKMHQSSKKMFKKGVGKKILDICLKELDLIN